MAPCDSSPLNFYLLIARAVENKWEPIKPDRTVPNHVVQFFQSQFPYWFPTIAQLETNRTKFYLIKNKKINKRLERWNST